MKSLKKSLTKKIGPLPVWGWAAAVGVFLLYHAGRLTGLLSSGGSGGGQATQGQQYVSGASNTPDLYGASGAPVSGGYSTDPNAGAGASTGTSTGTGDTGATSPGVDPGLLAILGALVASRTGTAASPTHPSNSKKKKKPPGHRAKHGKPHPKPKPSKSKPSKHKPRIARGKASIRALTGGRTKGSTKGKPHHAVEAHTAAAKPTPTSGSRSTAYSRLRRPPVEAHTSSTQRAPATHPAPARREAPRPAPRPSAPRRSAPRPQPKKR